MPEQETPSAPRPNARDRADREERSSGADKGDRVEKDARTEAEDAEHDSGGVPNQG